VCIIVARGACLVASFAAGVREAGAQTNKALRVLIRDNPSIRLILHWFDL
jgi:hypothetical protein